MKISRKLIGLSIVSSALALGIYAVVGQSVPAALDIASYPLFLKSPVTPAFIMAVDDSGSMDGEGSYITNDGALWWNTDTRSFVGLDRNDVPSPGTLNFNQAGNANAVWKKYVYLFPFGQSGPDGDQRIYADEVNDHFAVAPTRDFAFARSPQYNAAYFDPASSYEPWVRADGGSYPSYDSVPEFSAVPADPGRGGTRLNLAQNFAFENANEVFRMYEGMRIPAGSNYRILDRNPVGACPASAGFANTGSWASAPAGGLTIQNSNAGNRQEYCSLAFSYFPATFYMKAGSPLPAGYGYTGPTITGAVGPDGIPLLGYEIKPANFAAGKYLPAMTNFANWFAYYRKRHLATRAGITKSFKDTRQLRVGYFEINDLAPVTMLDLNNDIQRQSFYEQIVSLRGSGGTPNREAVNFIGNQFQRTGGGAPIVNKCQANYGMLFTDGFSNLSTPFAPGNVDAAGTTFFNHPVFNDAVPNTMADIVGYYYATNLRNDLPAGQVPISSDCDINDPRQDCNTNLHMNFFGITLGSRGLEYGVNAAATADPYANVPNWPTQFFMRHPSAVDDLWHAAINGRGKYLNARTPQAISDAMRAVLDVVTAPKQPAGTQTFTGARLNAESFNAVPELRRNGSDWSSTLTAYRINPADGSNGALLWEASAKLETLDYTARNIWTATSNINSSTRNVTVFNPSASLTAVSLGTNAAALTAYGVDQQQFFDYLRGARGLEGVSLRARSTLLGDIVNSTPEIVAAKDDFGWASASGLPAALRSSYTTYLTTAGTTGKQNRQSFVYVGANDGMLHAFGGDQPCTVSGQPAMCTPATAGTEAFAYIPNAVLGKVGQLANPDYQHQYYVDGNLVSGDIHTGSAWKTVLVGGMGAGGRGVFGLDISDPNNFDANDVLWEVNASTDGDIGHVMGRPVIVPVNYDGNTVRWVALFGNGYNSDRSEPALFMVDVNTGNVLQKLVPNDGDNVNPNGLGNIAAIDDDNDGLVDTVYGGDLQGKLWKFHFATGSWRVAFSGNPLFKAVDATGAAQPITSGIEVSAGPGNGVSIFFGTGRYFVNGDNDPGASPQVQSLYSIWDNGTAITGARATILQEQQISGVSATNPAFRNTTTNTTNYGTKRGWFLDLRVGTTAPTGERFIGTPRLQNGKVFFVTYEPLRDACAPGGRNWLYALDALSGAAAMSQVSLDPDGDPPVCTGNDCGGLELSTGAPVRDTSVLIPPPGSVPGLVGGCIPGTAGCVPPTTPTFQRCTLVIRAAGAPPLYLPRPCGRQSWRQVR